MAAIPALLNQNKKPIGGVAGLMSKLPANTTASPTPAATPLNRTGSWRDLFGKPQQSAVSTYMNSNQPSPSPSQTSSPTFTPYKPFEFTQANIEADPQYQAALATAQQNIRTGQNNTIANLVANGQGNSSYSAGVAQQIADKEYANVNNNILPQLIQQAYQRHQQDFANQNLLDQQNYGAGQDTINNNFRYGEDIGNVTSPEQQSAISHILNLKQQAEAPGITADQRAKLSAEADGWRNRLKAAGGNPDALGSNVSLANAGQANVGQRTLAGQQFDQGVKNDNLNAALSVGAQTGLNVTPQNDYSGLFRQVTNGANGNGQPLTQTQAGQAQTFGQGVTMAELTGHLPDGTPTTEEQQRVLGNLWTAAVNLGTIPNQLADILGVPHGTPTQEAYQFALNYQLNRDQFNLSASNSAADNARADRADARAEANSKSSANDKNAAAQEKAAQAQVDSDYGDDYAAVVANPSGAYEILKSEDGAKQFIKKYGTKRYQELLKLATPKG